MRSKPFAITIGALGATAALALAQGALAATPRTEGPGLKASEDSRYEALIATCQKNHPPPRPAFPTAQRGQRRAPRPASAYKPPSKVEAIDGVVAANAHWRHVWSESGNNADGIVGLPDGSVLVAQQDNSDVLRIDPQGHAHIAYQDTNTGGAVSINKKGEVFVVERGLHESIWELAPQHKIVAISYQGDPIDCLGAGGLNDLTAASNGGVYFTLGGLYYAAADGTVTREGDVTGTNGIILSPDEKTLYVTSSKSFTQPGNLVAFDVQPDGQLTNEHIVAPLTTSGDGSTVDSEGRIYVTSGSVIDVISPDGKTLGVIPGPKGDDLISVSFGGKDRHTLFAVGLAKKFHKGSLGLPSDKVQGGQGGELVAIHMLSQGYDGRAK
jgi:sugar lactone lactonase YvrE